MQFSDYQIFNLIKNLSQSKGISMGELQRKLNVSKNHLASACQNGTLRVDILLAISDIFGVDIIYFFTEGKEGGAKAIASKSTASGDKDRIEELEALLEEKERVIKAKEESLALYRKLGK